jgi:SAM-dependent methyltransferase
VTAGWSGQDRFIYTHDDVLRMLDALLESKGGAWWSEFFADRSKPCPFFVEWPDENLAEWCGEGMLAPGPVLELGCGHGRNATYLASLGYGVDAVDFSAEAIEWARERAKSAGASVAFQCCSIFDATFPEGSYDLVYDSGCFHHLAPHRRQDYVELVCRALKPGGSYGLVCLRPEGGSGYTDQQVYERASLGGAWATRKSACVPCGIGHPSPCACCGRCARQMVRGLASVRTSCGLCWPRRQGSAEIWPRSRRPGPYRHLCRDRGHAETAPIARAYTRC